MEKFPGSDKIKKIVKITGLTALSVLPKENTKAPELHFNKPNFDFADKEIYEDFRYQKLMPQYYLVDPRGRTSEEIQKDILNKEQNEKKLISFYDQGRQWVLDNINNPEFIKKFTESEQKSFNDSKSEFTKDFIDEKLDFMNEQAFDTDYIMSENIQNSYEKYAGRGIDSASAFYSGRDNKVYFPDKLDSINAINYAIHEYFHKVNVSGLPLESVKLFSQAFDSLSVIKNLSGQADKDTLKNIIYFSSPTEMYSRKKQFEHDLEKSCIWKYGEKFTFAHYKRAINLVKTGKFHFGSQQFFYSIKPNYFEKVMNEIP